MNFKNITDYKYSRLHYITPGSLGLIISKPVDPFTTIKAFPGLKALEVEFSKTAFKKDFDALSFINGLLANAQLEFLSIERGNNLAQLPQSLVKQPLLYFNLHADAITDFSETLAEIKSLQQLQLFFNEGRLGKKMGQLKQLTMLRIQADRVHDLDQIGELTNLEHLDLHVARMERLPETIGKLKKLKTLRITSSSLSELPASLSFPQLEDLTLSTLRNLKQLHAPLLESPHLKELRLYDLANELTLPHQLQMPALEKLSFSDFQLSAFPELLVPSLKELSLRKLNINRVCSKLKQCTQLENLALMELELDGDDIKELPSENITKYYGPVFSATGVMDFSIWPQLKDCTLSDAFLSTFSILDNHELKSLSVANNNTLRELNKIPIKVEDLKLGKCQALERIDLKEGSTALSYLQVSDAPLLSTLNLDGKSLPSFRILSLERCENLQHIPPALMVAPQLIDIRSHRNSSTLIDEQVDSLSTLLEYSKKNQFTEDELKVIGYWLFSSFRYQTPDAHIRSTSIRLLRFSNDAIFKLISKYFYELNVGKKKLADFAPQALEGKKVAIAGNTFEPKNTIKESLKGIKMKLVNALEEADFLLLGKKNESNTINTETLLFSESDLHHYLDQHQPKFLKQETVTDAHLSSLRQIMWSTNPETELMALEMMKNGGLPDEVIGEAIIIAKTSEDKSVRAKYKNFLKGKISEEAFNLVSRNVRFDPDHRDPFYSLQADFSQELLGKVVMALYQRTKNFGTTVLSIHQGDYDLRKDIVINQLVPIINERPHYISFHCNLTNEELSFILSLPIIQGQLKRLHISVNGPDLPEALGKHTTLKELIINGNLSGKTMPSVLFDLKRLSELSIHSDTLESIDERIGQLKELKSIVIYNKIPVQLPESIRSLSKLKRVYFTVGVADHENWSEFFKSL